MSSANAQVKPGKTPTCIIGNVTEDETTLYNPDANNGVWVDSVSSLQPGSGMFLGPFGTIVWSTKGVPLYAICDTGVATPVAIQVSGDVNNIVNPLALAVATAQQISAIGVPQTILQTTIFSGTIPNNSSIPALLDVSKYSSIIVFTQVAKLTLDFCLDSFGNQLVKELIVPGNVEIRNPGSWLNVINSTSGVAQVTIVGTNRNAESWGQNDSNVAFWDATGLPTTLVAGTRYTLIESTAVQLTPGLAYLYAFVGTAVGVKGYFIAVDVNGSEQALVDTADMVAGSGGGVQATRLAAIPLIQSVKFYCKVGGTISSGFGLQLSLTSGNSRYV